MNTTHEQYLGMLMMLGFAAAICTLMVTISWLFGPKKVTPYKQSPYECGVTPDGSARERFPIKFYILAIVFILFDIEVVFLWSWMTVFKHSSREFQIFSFFEMIVYMITWVVGYVYMLKVGAIDWDETENLAVTGVESGG
ncbi:MAG: NADH-quinone oxidoreductase subunit A [Fimbriimonadaceae bacterium]